MKLNFKLYPKEIDFMIYRDIEPQLEHCANKFPIVAVMGPRQSGKTTLAKDVFKNHKYISLQNLDIRKRIQNDPRSFFKSLHDLPGVILDEIQEVPKLLSYMREIADDIYKPGFFIIIGSQLLLYENIPQSLSGKIGLLTLLPLSVNELKNADLLPKSLDDLIVKGFYPISYSQSIEVSLWQDSYIKTYIEKHVRQMQNFTNLSAFQKMLILSAARTGNLVNYSNIANEAGVSSHTIKSWLSVLESSFICFELPPYYGNFNKRIVKAHKLYFYDTGIICFLLGIRTGADLAVHPLRGAIFETFVINEIMKYLYSISNPSRLYYWKDVKGHEVDCIIEKGHKQLIPIEAKSGATIQPEAFKSLIFWQELTEQKPEESYIIYGGNDNYSGKNGNLIAWDNIQDLLKKVLK